VYFPGSAAVVRNGNYWKAVECFWLLLISSNIAPKPATIEMGKRSRALQYQPDARDEAISSGA
jgi:hypothetical protein